MTEVVVFHHALGLTAGVREFAEQLRAVEHQVTVPDLFEGERFDTVAEGVAHAQQIGFDTLLDRGRAAVADLPHELVYAGFSLGVMPAQMLAQTRPGARGALLFHACVPPSEFGPGWPAGVPVQVHAMEDDALLLADGDLDVARDLADTVDEARLFLYPGDGHLFADPGLPDYDAGAALLLEYRVLGFLAVPSPHPHGDHARRVRGWCGRGDAGRGCPVVGTASPMRTRWSARPRSSACSTTTTSEPTTTGPRPPFSTAPCGTPARGQGVTSPVTTAEGATQAVGSTLPMERQ